MVNSFVVCVLARTRKNATARSKR